MSAALRNDFRSRSDSPVVLRENTITGSPSKNGSAVRHPPAPNRACRAATGRQSPIKLWLPDGPSHIEDLERILSAPRRTVRFRANLVHRAHSSSATDRASCPRPAGPALLLIGKLRHLGPILCLEPGTKID